MMVDILRGTEFSDVVLISNSSSVIWTQTYEFQLCYNFMTAKICLVVYPCSWAMSFLIKLIVGYVS